MDLFAVQGTLKSLPQSHSSKASILHHSAFFIVQLSHPYMTTGKTIALTRWTFIDKVISLLFNMLSWLVVTFFPRSKHLLITLSDTIKFVFTKGMKGFPWWLNGKESISHCRGCRFDPWAGKILWRRKWKPTPVFLPGKSHGQRTLVGYI